MHQTVDGTDFVIDILLQSDSYLSTAMPYFNSPSNNKTFHPGSLASSPGLVVLLSTTKNVTGTPFKGHSTNLAGLFQLTGTASAGKVQNIWLPGKALFGVDVESTLTVFVVNGTSPAYVPEPFPRAISPIVKVPFTIAGGRTCYTRTQYDDIVTKICKYKHPKQATSACKHAIIKEQESRVYKTTPAIGMNKICM